jgi:hypothetical protein
LDQPLRIEPRKTVEAQETVEPMHLDSINRLDDFFFKLLIDIQ